MRLTADRGWPAVWLGLLLLLAWSFPGPLAQAQTATPAPATGTTTSRPDALWQCTLPGGTYLVALRSIASISTHEYIVDGAARVTEFTIATNSTVEARFYYLEPLATSALSGNPAASALAMAQQHLADVSSQAGAEPVWMKVVKNYPTTTHAHTVEYRLSTKENLQQLYQNLSQAWTTGKGANITSQ